MDTYVLLFNYKRSTLLKGDDLSQAVEETANGRPRWNRWSGGQCSLMRGDEVFLYAQGRGPHFVFAHGSVQSADVVIRPLPGEDEAKRMFPILWDRVLPHAQGISEDRLMDHLPQERWRGRMGAAVLAHDDAKVLRDLWGRQVLAAN